MTYLAAFLAALLSLATFAFGLAAGTALGLLAASPRPWNKPARADRHAAADRDADDGIQPPDPRTWSVTVPPACERGPDSWRLREVGR